MTKHGVRLRPDLYEHLPMYTTEAESVEAEGLLRTNLERLGYRVWGGTRGMNQAFNPNVGT